MSVIALHQVTCGALPALTASFRPPPQPAWVFPHIRSLSQGAESGTYRLAISVQNINVISITPGAAAPVGRNRVREMTREWRCPYCIVGGFDFQKMIRNSHNELVCP